MRSNTATQFNSLLERVAEQYQADLPSVRNGKYFSITGPQEEKFLGALQSKIDFLNKINMPLVTDIQGEKVFAGLQQTITGRKENGRFRKKMGPDGNTYLCVATDSGVIIPWATMDVWARLGDQFMAKYAAFVQQQIGLDQIMIGWRGINAAKNTDPNKNTLLQDVNAGWMEWMRKYRPANLLEQGKQKNIIRIFGEDADYLNLDDLAYDLRQGLAELHRERTDLVFLVGADLVAKEAELVSKSHGLTPHRTRCHETTRPNGCLRCTASDDCS